MTYFICSSVRGFFRHCLAGAAVLTLSGNLQAGLSPLKLSASFAPEAEVGTSVTLRVNGAEGQIYEVQSSKDLKPGAPWDWVSCTGANCGLSNSFPRSGRAATTLQPG
jgi:hypothetical protein